MPLSVLRRRGLALLALGLHACRRDLEGLGAKRKSDPYLPGASWLKIRKSQVFLMGGARRAVCAGKASGTR